MEKSDIFKSTNYKFIEFKKSTRNDSDRLRLSSAESIKGFYEELISDVNEKPVEVEPSKPVKKSNKKVTVASKVHIKPNDFLKAVQNDDLKIVRNYCEQNSDVNVVDDFKWNALMIAIASKNTDIIEYFFENLNKDQLIRFLGDQDSSSNTCESLALKFNNKKALEYIKSLNSEPEPTSTETEPSVLHDFYCDSCQKQFNQSDKSHIEHVTSIVHQLNEHDWATLEEQRKLLYNYHLRPSNKGYQLLVKSGWNESSGLGLNEQGKVAPIKARQKLDRYGIGIEPKPNKYFNKKKLIISTESTKTTLSSLKETKRRNEKMKKLERNLRLHFND